VRITPTTETLPYAVLGSPLHSAQCFLKHGHLTNVCALKGEKEVCWATATSEAQVASEIGKDCNYNLPMLF
jgi:hypothetical protein